MINTLKEILITQSYFKSIGVEYYFTVTGSVACVTSVSVTEREALRIYPNPASDYFRMTKTDEIMQLVVYNVLGNRIKIFDVNGNQNFEIYDLPKGNYFVTLIDKEFNSFKTIPLQKQ